MPARPRLRAQPDGARELEPRAGGLGITTRMVGRWAARAVGQKACGVLARHGVGPCAAREQPAATSGHGGRARLAHHDSDGVRVMRPGGPPGPGPQTLAGDKTPSSRDQLSRDHRIWPGA
jgi:hypothetical protein